MSEKSEKGGKTRKRYAKPQLKKHNEIVEQTNRFNVGGPPSGGPSAAAVASPTVPGATVF